jgi:uncharacterized membrane protein YciS (DUF1049 family)
MGLFLIGSANNRTEHEHFARLHPIVRYRMKLKLVVGNSSWWSVLAGMAFAGRAYRWLSCVMTSQKSKVKNHETEDKIKNQKNTGMLQKKNLVPTSVSISPRIALSFGHPR